MARDAGLEALVNDVLRGQPGIVQKGMMGGWVWMQHGHLLCGARVDGVLFRLGKDHVAWALALPGISPMMSGTRPMKGWVRASPETCGDSGVFERLTESALAFVATLPLRP